MVAMTPHHHEDGGFGTTDIIVFSLTLAGSAGIGIYFARAGGRNQSNNEYLMAGRSMSAIPVAISVLASFVSSIAILGTSNEIYTYGFTYFLLVISPLITIPLVAYVYLPVYYHLKLTSTYEYLEKRFSRSVKILASVIFIIQTLLYLAIALYGPSLTLEAVTGFPLWVGVLVVGLLCTAYTTLGGMKAVIWTDVFQGLVMLIGLFIIIIVGADHVGGMKRVFQIAKNGSRFDFDYSFDPTHRLTVWMMIFAGVFQNLPVYVTNQTAVQRFLTTKSLKSAKRAVWMNMPLNWINSTITALVGLVLYAYYADCDPLSSGNIKKGDEILPHFVVYVLGKSVPGLPGVFVACLFCATLSTVASGLNSLAAVTVEDFISYCFVIPKERETMYSKVLVLIYGFASLGLAFLASKLGMILQMSATMFGVIGGPMLGIFTLGILSKTANTKGVLTGSILAFFVVTWISIGAQVYPPNYPTLPISIEGCHENITTNSTLFPIHHLQKSPYTFYNISFFLYGPIGFIITIAVGLFVSFIFRHEYSRNIDPRLMFDCKSFFTCSRGCYDKDDIEIDSDQETCPLYNDHETKIR